MTWNALALTAALLLAPSIAFAQTSTTQGEDVKARENAQKLLSDLKSKKLRLGADLFEIMEKYGTPYKTDIAESVSELRYRYSKGFDQRHVLIWLYFDKNQKLVQWRHDEP